MKNFINSWILFVLVIVAVLSLPARVPFLKKILFNPEDRDV